MQFEHGPEPHARRRAQIALEQLSFFDRCEDFRALVGQAIAFCGLSCLGKAAARQTTKTDRLSHVSGLYFPGLSDQGGTMPFTRA